MRSSRSTTIASVGVCTRPTVAAAGDPRALTSQAGLAVREMELLGEVLRDEVGKGA